jgi:hypothetical protein
LRSVITDPIGYRSEIFSPKIESLNEEWNLDAFRLQSSEHSWNRERLEITGTCNHLNNKQVALDNERIPTGGEMVRV